MSCWPICTAYLNILLSGCAMNCEEKNFPLETSFLCLPLSCAFGPLSNEALPPGQSTSQPLHPLSWAFHI